MSTPKPVRQSLFFQDLATPISSTRSRGRFSSQNSDLPPPPPFTLEDKSDFSPELDPSSPSPLPQECSRISQEFATPLKNLQHGASSSCSDSPVVGLSSNWWSASKSSGGAGSGFGGGSGLGGGGIGNGGLGGGGISNGGSDFGGGGFGSGGGGIGNGGIGKGGIFSSGGGLEGGDKGKGSPVEGVVEDEVMRESSPREGGRTEMRWGSLDEEEWVTVYGFSLAETNLVLREFEKCGPILKHVPGPREANWMHILYQNRFDAQKALCKNGTQLNGFLIIGVKPVDPIQRQALNEKLKHQGFVPLPHSSSKTSESNSASPHPYHLQNGSSSIRAGGTVATPTKSYMSKIIDLMFGV